MWPLASTITFAFVASAYDFQDSRVLLRNLNLPNWQALADAPTELQEPVPGMQLRYKLLIPAPLCKKDIEELADRLSLAAPQILHLDRLLGEYSAEIDRIRMHVIPGVTRLAEASTVYEEDKVQYAGLYEDYVAAETSARRRVLASERSLMYALEEVLAESQKSSLFRVTAQRARAHLPAGLVWMPTVWIDVIDLSQGAGVDHSTISHLVFDYERSIGPILEELSDEVVGRRGVLARLRAGLVTSGDPAVDKATLADYFRQCATLRKKGAALEARVRDLNNELARRIAECNNNEQGSSFIAEYLRLAYPHVYPDPGDPLSIYRLLGSRFEDQEALRDALEAIWLEYRREYEKHIAQMKGESDKWFEQLALTGSHRGEGEYRDHLAELVRTRAKGNLSVLRQMAQLVPGEAIDSVRTEWDACHGTNTALSGVDDNSAEPQRP